MKLFIDPGHGGRDSGAYGPTGFKEKDFNMETAELLQIACDRAGIATMWSRISDINVSERASTIAANNWGADFYVAIHANGFHDPRVNGCEVLYWHSSPRGAAWAGQLQDEIISRFVLLTDRGTKPLAPGARGETVLRRTNMPAVIIEPGFITNPRDEDMLKKFNTQAKIADAIVSSISGLHLV